MRIVRIPFGRENRLGQRLQTPCDAGLVASLVADSVDPRHVEIPTDRRSQLVNAASDADADFAKQGNASRVFLACSPHHAAEIVQLLRQLDRHGTAGIGIGFGPVE